MNFECDVLIILEHTVLKKLHAQRMLSIKVNIMQMKIHQKILKKIVCVGQRLMYPIIKNEKTYTPR